MILSRTSPFGVSLRGLSTTKLLSISAFSLFLLYFGKIWYSYRFFARRGLKTPPYQFFFGNFREIRKGKKISQVLIEWTKKYGKTYGYFQGHTPFIVTSDLQMINEIFIKQHKNFSAKKRLPLDREDDASKVPIIAATKGKWKRMRSIMNPTFSSSKMKELLPTMQMCVDRLLEKIDDNIEKEVEVMSLIKRFTMDTIWNVGFGLDRDMQYSSKGDLYITNSDESLRKFADYTFIMYLATYFTEIRRFIVYFHLIKNHIAIRLFGEKFVDPLFWIREEVIEVVEARKRELDSATNLPKKRDYLQILMDAHCENAECLEENEKTDFGQLYFSNKLSIDEIKMNLSIFLMTGSEATSIAITELIYMVAVHQEEQDKLFQEIEDHYPADSGIKPDYENIQKLEYLDMFIKETLRLYPIGHPACTRRCVKHTTVNGIDIPEDVTVVADVMSIHYDPDLWGPVDPSEFYPQRFATKRHPLAFMAFGQGPRNCIGIKFAYTELKMTLIKILRKFQVVPCEKTVKELNFIEGVIGIFDHDITLVFKRR